MLHEGAGGSSGVGGAADALLHQQQQQQQGGLGCLGNRLPLLQDVHTMQV
jgi:hypothetical protein